MTLQAIYISIITNNLLRNLQVFLFNINKHYVIEWHGIIWRLVINTGNYIRGENKQSFKICGSTV